MTITLDGKSLSEKIKSDLSIQVNDALSSGKLRRKPHLAVVIVGDNPASHKYVNAKEKACSKVNFDSSVFRYPPDISQQELLNIVLDINKNNDIDGLLVQLPLPKHIDTQIIIDNIDPNKDVDGFHPINIGKLVLSDPKNDYPIACTPKGIITLLEHYQVKIDSKNAVIIGRSNIVAKPLAHLLLKRNATVTICHSKTADIKSCTKNAEIIIVSTGRPNTLTYDMVKPNSTIVDVGINVVDNTIVGDTDFKNLHETAHAITPVPGGVGPMTIASLLQNTLECALSAK